MKNLIEMCIFSTLLCIQSMECAQNNIYYKKGGLCECCRGPAGIPGNNGIPGNPGINGVAGDKGQKGDKGEMGLRGMTGRQGPNGFKGDKGFRGRKGTKGEHGQRGPKGEIGYTGPAGPKGSKGQKGQSAIQIPKVAFSVNRSTRLGPVTDDTTITFDKVLINLGDSFDIFSSHFITKVNGTYIFMANILCNLESDAYAWIMVNGRYTVPMHGDHRAGYGTGSNTIIYHLLQDDHVWIQLMKNSSLLNDFSTFSGYLLYMD